MGSAVANVFRPEFDETRDRPGFRAQRARVGQQVGAERLGASIWEVPSGEAAYPYHLHLGEEELVIVPPAALLCALRTAGVSWKQARSSASRAAKLVRTNS